MAAEELAAAEVRVAAARRRSDAVAFRVDSVAHGTSVSWTVWRRYSEFAALDSALRTLFAPHTPPSSLPGTLAHDCLRLWVRACTAMRMVDDNDDDDDAIDVAEDGSVHPPSRATSPTAVRLAALNVFLRGITGVAAVNNGWMRCRELVLFLAPPAALADAHAIELLRKGTPLVAAALVPTDSQPHVDVMRRVQVLLRRAATAHVHTADHPLVLDLSTGLLVLQNRTPQNNVLNTEITTALRRLAQIVLDGDVNSTNDTNDSSHVATTTTTSLAKGGSTYNTKQTHPSIGADATTTGAGVVAADGADRRELLQGATTSATATNTSRRRVFGVAATETPETAGRTDEELVAAQRATMQIHDDALLGLRAVVRRQRELGTAIGTELELHNNILGEMNTAATRTSARLRAADTKAISMTR